MKNDVEMIFEINDKFDICVKLRSKDPQDEDEKVYFYYENGVNNISQSAINGEDFNLSL